MYGSLVSHDRILNEPRKCRSWLYLSRLWRGSLRSASIKTLLDLLDHDDQLRAPINLITEFCQLNEIQRG
jgi:hypothetical protein